MGFNPSSFYIFTSQTKVYFYLNVLFDQVINSFKSITRITFLHSGFYRLFVIISPSNPSVSIFKLRRYSI